MAYAKADRVVEQILKVPNVETVGALAGGGESLIASQTGAEQDYSRYEFFVIPDSSVTKEKQVFDICEGIRNRTKNLDGEITVSSSSVGDMGTLMGNGLEIQVYGSDLDRLMDISKEIEGLVKKVDGFENISNGQEEGDQVMRLVINKDKAMRKGLTVAQIYSSISDGLTREKEAATVTIDGQDLKVDIVDEDSLLKKETLLNLELEASTPGEDGSEEKKTYKLKDFAEVKYEQGVATIARENSSRMMTVSADTKKGYNTTRLAQKVQTLLDKVHFPDGYSASIGGETENTMDMVRQMVEMLATEKTGQTVFGLPG